MAEVGIELRPAAERELASIVDFLWQRSPELAERFATEYREAIYAIRDFPNAGAPTASGERKRQVGRGPYWIIYRVSQGTAHGLAVAHSSRRPGYWRERL